MRHTNTIQITKWKLIAFIEIQEVTALKQKNIMQEKGTICQKVAIKII
jgi:hypothetical protein